MLRASDSHTVCCPGAQPLGAADQGWGCWAWGELEAGLWRVDGAERRPLPKPPPLRATLLISQTVGKEAVYEIK